MLCSLCMQTHQTLTYFTKGQQSKDEVENTFLIVLKIEEQLRS